jgi:N-methylhydantoinase A
MPFGGAGPMHAAAIATELGVERILCPRAGGVLSALGLLASERRRDTARTVMLGGDAMTAERIAAVVAELRERLGSGLDEARAEVAYELRYRGQAFELPVERAGDEPAEPGDLRDAFAAAHAERYGYADDEADVELVTLRVTATAPGPDVDLERAAGQASEPAGRRDAVFGGERVEAVLWRGELAPGTRVEGPAVCELPEATLVVAPGWRGEVDSTGAVKLERER